MTTKQVKKFDEHLYSVKLQELTKQLKAYKELIRLVKSLNEDCDNVNELFDVINTKTGFLNSRMSFDALNLSSEYRLILELQSNSKDILPTSLDNSLEFTQAFLNDLKTSFTTYYTADQIKAIKAIEKVISECNKLPFEHRKLLGFNNSGELVKGPWFERNFN